MQQTSLEELCISGLAAKHNNASFCRKLSYDGKRICYPLVATVTNNPNVCALAGSEKDYCYMQYASNAKDASICDSITNIDDKDSCYSKLASDLADPALCDKMKTAGQKNGCYWNIAMRFRDVSYCNKITEEGQKQNCLQNIQPSQQPSQPQPPK